ncbi:MAG: disulfide bond formation protein B [Oxalobacter sp.]|nr:MAG: disulfide bond formation protein B [Oxalobacter sp.]
MRQGLQRYARISALLMAIGALALVAIAVILTQHLSLQPCHLCVFQRVLFLGISLALLFAWGGWNGRWIPKVSLIKSAVISIGGLATAGYQVWLQWYPQSSFGCGVGQQGIIERFVNWLAQFSPLLFKAGGLCEEDDLVIFGLSIAVWSFLAFAGLLIGSLTLLMARRKKY